MIYEFENWCFSMDIETGEVNQPVLPTVSNGDSFIRCNITQFTDTKIFEGIKNLQFIECTLVNCDLDATSEVDDLSNTAQVVYEVEEDV